MARRQITFILVRVLAGYIGRIQRTVVDYRAAAAARIQGWNKYIDHMHQNREIDSAVFRDHIIPNPSWVHAFGICVFRQTVLMLSAYHVRVDCCRFAIDAGADVDTRGTNYCTALHIAAESCHVDVCRLLVASGADIALKCQIYNYAGGCTLLEHAVRNGHVAQRQCVDVCRFLVQNGANVNARDDEGSTALHQSAWSCQLYSQRNIELCRFLMEAGANVNAEDDEGTTVLHVAVRHRRIEVCRYLLDIGADVSAKSCHSTPLHVYASSGESDMKDGVLQLLFDSVIDVHAVNDKGRTALHTAAHISYYDPRIANTTIAFLVKAGARVRAVDHDGCTALLLATEAGMVANVRSLVESGANVNETNNSGATAFELASKCFVYERGKEIQCYLRSVGAGAGKL